MARNKARSRVKLPRKIGFPVVLKIVSQDFLHKSEVKGIEVNLKSKAESHQRLGIRSCERQKKPIQMPEVDGCMVEAMAEPGQEVILGMKRDASFGPVMMFGLGGIFVELFNDVAFRVAPITRWDVIEMISETRAGVLLKGYRGQAGSGHGSHCGLCIAVEPTGMDFPQIS